MGLSEYTKMFLEFESNNNMFKKKINGIEYWVYIRFEIFYYIASLLKLSGMDRSDNPYRKTEFDFAVKDNIHNRLFCNQDRLKKKDIMIIPDRRLFPIKSRFRCIYTDYLEKRIKKKYCVLSFGDAHYNTNIRLNFKNLYFVDLAKFQKKEGISTNQFPRIDKAIFFNEVVTPLEQYFGIEIADDVAYEWMESTYSKLSRHELYTKYYEWVLGKVTPKLIIFTDYYCYYHMILCEVAKKNKIPVVELQHGVVNEYHISYNFPKIGSCNSFPDYFFSFGLKEKESAMPIEKSRIIPVGFPEIEAASKKVRKNKPVILVVSSIDSEFARVAAKLSKILGDTYDYIYKLHPLELDGWQSSVGEVFKDTPYTIVDTMDKTIHYYLNMADWVIGIGSTSLFEATNFDCKIVVQKMREYESCEVLYKNGYAMLAEDVNELADIIIRNDFTPKKDGYFYMKNSLDNMINAIDDILEGKI